MFWFLKSRRCYHRQRCSIFLAQTLSNSSPSTDPLLSWSWCIMATSRPTYASLGTVILVSWNRPRPTSGLSRSPTVWPTWRGRSTFTGRRHLQWLLSVLSLQALLVWRSCIWIVGMVITVHRRPLIIETSIYFYCRTWFFSCTFGAIRLGRVVWGVKGVVPRTTSQQSPDLLGSRPW